jgi:Uma2 family endonuclease
MVAQPKLYTVSEFEDFLGQPENRGRLFELINGEIIEKMPTEEHGVIVMKLGARLVIYVEAHQLGRVASETRYQMPQDEHNGRLPDISFRSNPDTPVVRQGPVMQMPDLAVEVKSPDDTYRELREKADYYLANGARMVWLIYPEKRLVEVHTPDDFDLLNDSDTLDGGDVLPGFTLPVREIFQV